MNNRPVQLTSDAISISISLLCFSLFLSRSLPLSLSALTLSLDDRLAAWRARSLPTVRMAESDDRKRVHTRSQLRANRIGIAQ
jgi:hypothetical protein